MNTYKNNYIKWKNIYDDELESQVDFSFLDDDNDVREAFSEKLEFGTSGIRGIMGQGIGRINLRVIAYVTTGLGYYILKNTKAGHKAKVVIAYDSRINSKNYAEMTAIVLSKLNIEVSLFKRMTSVPVLSYAIRTGEFDYGIIITASHNNKQYNGYKVYGSKGYQILPKEAHAMLEEIKKIDIYSDYLIPKEKNLEGIKILDENMENDFIEKIYQVLVTYDTCNILKDENLVKKLNVVYSGLNGTGNYPVPKLLEKLGANFRQVKEQSYEDGNFPTCSNPNPERKDVYELSLKKLREMRGDNCTSGIVIMTDPDCDRMGIATDEKLFTGNQIAILIIDFLIESGKYSKYVYKSIVSTELVTEICKEHNIKIRNSLIGFKFLGEYIEENDDFLLAFEEGNGYLYTNLLRDKDGIGASGIAYLMSLYWISKGKTLEDRLEEIYEKYGYYQEKTFAITFEGLEGQNKMLEFMDKLRADKKTYMKEFQCNTYYDYSNRLSLFLNDSGNLVENKIFNKSKSLLPKSNIIEISNQYSKIILRPSGTEPKLKLYMMVKGACLNDGIYSIENNYTKMISMIEKF